MRRTLLIIAILFLISCSCKGQSYHCLNIKEFDRYPPEILFNNCFGNLDRCLLFAYQDCDYKVYSSSDSIRTHRDTYYVLDVLNAKIQDFDEVSKLGTPLAFINNDSLVIKRSTDNNWIYYSMKTGLCSLIQSPSLILLLYRIPDTIYQGGTICYFNPTTNRMLTFNRFEESTILSVYSCTNGDIDTLRINVDTIAKQSKQVLYEARWLNDTSILLFTIKDIMSECKYFIFQVQDNMILPVSTHTLGKGYEIEDSFENRCIVSSANERLLCEINPQTGNVFPLGKFEIIDNAGCPSCRMAMISPEIIAFMTTTQLDYHSFEPYLNYCKTSVTFTPIR